MKSPLSRRAVLAGLAASACAPLEAEVPAPPDFPLGVSAGDPQPDGAVLWTRYVGHHALMLELERLGEAPTTREVTPDETGIVIAPLTGLAPGEWYAYAFVAHDGGVEVARSERGRFRTAPALDALVPLHFGASSCARQTAAMTPFVRAAEEFEFDAFLLLGDTVYADGATTLEEYREKWRGALARRPNRLLRASTGVINTWDDHEIVNDARGDLVPPARLEAARQAIFEHQPWTSDGAMPRRLWRRLRFGLTAELFVLDCRSERNRERDEYLSREQLDWLKAGLAASPARFKLILNSVPMSSYPGGFFGAFAHDRWEGWPTQRLELLRFIDETPIDGVVWLTGDFHMGVAGRVAKEGPGSTQVELACGPAGSSANPSPSYPSPPQFDFATAVQNLVSLRLDPIAGRIQAQFLDGGTRTLFERTY